MNKFAFIALTIFAIIASTVSADKPKALRRLQTATPVSVPIAVVAPVATPTTASSSKGSKRQLVHYNTPYEA
eukprot:CAMPEP_0113655402 /NCGR_PEP_ID=MMETSP0017_2-20120614/29692_1 /TAXON_ID=2856 /ORGANISM="Cylindrotheca closterium" /LENGTH=71 /DNA_ID=CAMNT_0000568657 /DNA_START=46 /DNA_END=261 /DNA_ORIENTATION=+ /assembly_acc=CAM_ASM_000147